MPAEQKWPQKMLRRRRCKLLQLQFMQLHQYGAAATMTKILRTGKDRLAGGAVASQMRSTRASAGSKAGVESAWVKCQKD
eukprot:4243062-Pleurochrysis_carterae.AAC.2